VVSEVKRRCSPKFRIHFAFEKVTDAKTARVPAPSPHARRYGQAPPARKLHSSSTVVTNVSPINIPSSDNMHTNRQLAYAPTPYIPRSALSATINLDEV
jgi:hypothetical protein